MTQSVRNICAALSPLPPTAPDRIEIFPVGAFRLADKRGRLEMRLDDPDTVIRASFQRAAGHVLPIDFDHRSFAGQGQADTRAAGWITGMDVEGSRVWASVEWTDEGRKALETRSYRFVSPVFRNLPDGRVVLIEGAGLVNVPALPQLRQVASKENDMNPIDQIAALLGLSADAPDEIVARVTALQDAETQLASIRQAAGVSGDDATRQICSRLEAAAPDPTAFVPKASFDELQTQFASLQQGIQADRVEVALERAREEGKLTPDLDAWATQLASKDLGEFEAWAKVAPVRVSIGTRTLAGRKPPVKTDALDETERQVASAMGLSDEAFLATRNAALKETAK